MWNILFFSFLVALTGALTPGPLLTFTVYKSLTQKRGYLAGIYIVLGHATIEFFLIIALLAGASFFFQNTLFLMSVGIVGGIFLLTFGLFVIRNVSKKNFNGNLEIGEQQIRGFKGNSFLGGILVSISNPYWELWWAVIGLGFMINFKISFVNPIGILAFFIGHELGDIVWYLPISTFIYLGGKILNYKIYKYILIFCGGFMVVFGIYLIINIIIFPPMI